MALYRRSWHDARQWSDADERRRDTVCSEDFEAERLYGLVRVRNPFQ